MSSSLEVAGDDFDSPKSETEVDEQSELLAIPSESTEKNSRMMKPELNAVEHSKIIVNLSDFLNFLTKLLTKFPCQLLQLVSRSLHLPSAVCKELTKEMECITANFKLYVSAQSDKIEFYLAIKDALEKTSKNSYNRLTFIKIRLAVDLIKSEVPLLRRSTDNMRLKGSFNAMSRTIHRRFPTHQELLDALNETNKTIDLYIAGCMALKNIVLEILQIMSELVSQKSRFEDSVLNIEDIKFIEVEELANQSLSQTRKIFVALLK